MTWVPLASYYAGSQLWRAPELQGAHVTRTNTPAADMWSVGLVIYEMLTGTMAYCKLGSRRPVSDWQILSAAGKSPETVVPLPSGAHPAVVEAMRACLVLDPSLRATARSARDILLQRSGAVTTGASLEEARVPAARGAVPQAARRSMDAATGAGGAATSAAAVAGRPPIPMLDTCGLKSTTQLKNDGLPMPHLSPSQQKHLQECDKPTVAAALVHPLPTIELGALLPAHRTLQSSMTSPGLLPPRHSSASQAADAANRPAGIMNMRSPGGSTSARCKVRARQNREGRSFGIAVRVTSSSSWYAATLGC
jgi:serine/threonine protein kinase